MVVKGIIFDLGQTLIYADGDWPAIALAGAEAMAEWYLKKKHIKLDTTALIEAFLAEREIDRQTALQTRQEITAQQTLREVLKKIEAPASTGATVEAAIKTFFGPEEETWQLYPEVIETLKELKSQQYRLGLYSNATDDALIQRLVNRSGLRPYLSPTFSSAGWGWRKPRPEVFELIAQRWGLSPQEVTVVGDDLEADIAGAQQAGMPGILLLRDRAASGLHAKVIQPAATLSSLMELPAVLTRLKALTRP
jgi:putative hydrolase of the HAD superfamily